MKILALKWRRLGDTILWTAALAALRDQFPDAEIDLAFPAAYADCFTHDPRFTLHFPLQQSNPTKFTAQWRARAYDLALGFHVSATTRQLLREAHARETILHHHDRRGKNFGSARRIVSLGQPMSAIERDANVVRTLGWQGVITAPKLIVGNTWRETAASAWPKSSQKRVFLGPGASRPAKQWPLERYAQLAETLSKDAEVGVLYDQEAAFRGHRRLRTAIAKHARLVATPTLGEAIGNLQNADAYAGSDSGIKHLAAALGKPTVTFFGPESIGEWHGYDETRHTALQIAVGCRDRDSEDPRFAWCAAEVCPLASHACLSLIGVKEAAEAVLTALGRRSRD